MDEHNSLNETYKTLNDEKNFIIKYVENIGLKSKVGYYPFHSFKKGNEFFLEQYPIPVITVEEKIDIGIDVHQVFFEIKLDRRLAESFDYQIFKDFSFEVYGIKDYYNDFYNGKIDKICANIISSDENEIGVSINIQKKSLQSTCEEVIEILRAICKI